MTSSAYYRERRRVSVNGKSRQMDIAAQRLPGRRPQAYLRLMEKGAAYRAGAAAGMEKTAVDPITAAGGAFAGKMALTNFLYRHGLKFAPIRRVASEALGVGVRTGAQGKPIMSRPVRELLSVIGEPTTVKAYERAHAVGKSLGPYRLMQMAKAKAAGKKIPIVGGSAAHKLLGHFKDEARVLENVPLESKGVRRAVDFLFTPLSKVPSELREEVKRIRAERRRVPKILDLKPKANLPARRPPNLASIYGRRGIV